MKFRGWIFSLGLALALGAAPAHAQLFGESNADKAARLAHEADQDSHIGQLMDRTKELEDKVQSLTQSLSQATGANEELGHRLQQLNDRLDRQEKDFAYRLCMLSAQQLGAGAGDQGLNCAAAGSGNGGGAPPVSLSSGPGGLTPGASLPPIGGDTGGGAGGGNGGGSTIDATGGPRMLGRPPGLLGTLPAGPPPRASGGGFAPAPASGGGNSRQFDMAMNLLAKAQYAEASAAFRAYADANPGDTDMTPQAIYWIGDIAYVQQDYPTAIAAFAEQIKKYPSSSRSPDSMLKLGQSLLATGQTSGGCTTLAALKTRYPQASAATLAAAAGARKASCGR